MKNWTRQQPIRASICSGFLTVVILNIEYLLWQWSGNTTFVSLGIHFFIEIRNTLGSLESLVPRFNISIILHYKALAKRTRKSTCVQLTFRLATHVASTCINLRLLAWTCVDFARAQIYSGKRTEWSPIRSVIIRVITDRHRTT